MIKRTLIAIAVVALLATSAHAALTTHYLGNPDPNSTIGVGQVKVDGSQTHTARWPFTWSYKALVVCNIPIKMKVGMYVQILDCNKKSITLVQEDCGDVGQGAGDYPCYLGCVELQVRSNFPAQMGLALHKAGDVITSWSSYFDGDSIVPGDGDYHKVTVCVKAWKTAIYKAAPGDSVSVGSIDVTVKPAS